MKKEIHVTCAVNHVVLAVIVGQLVVVANVAQIV